MKSILTFVLAGATSALAEEWKAHFKPFLELYCYDCHGDGIKRLNEEGAFALFLDLHNPGPGDGKPFFFGSPESHLNPRRKANQKRFHEHCLKTLGKHPLGFSEKVRITGTGYHPLWRRISKNWVAENTAPNSVNLTLETTWNSPHSTQNGYQAYGAALGQAIANYFKPAR